MNGTIEERFWSKVDRSGGAKACWLWKGSSQRGYGRFRIGGRKGRVIGAHRLAWELAHGRRPKSGMVVMHRCDNPRCVNPRHLREATQSVNRADCVRKNRHARGSRNGASVLSERQVRQIKKRLKRGDRQATIARDYSMARDVIWNIAKGRTWSWLDRKG